MLDSCGPVVLGIEVMRVATINNDIENMLWAAADQLRANSNLKFIPYLC